MSRGRGRSVALVLVVMASMTFFDLDTVNRLLFGASQSLHTYDQHQSRALKDENSTLVTRDSNLTREEYMEVIQQQLEELQEEQVHFNSTFVTAYFELPESKHKHQEYMKWAKKSLCINDPMIVFTQLEFVDEFLELRSNVPNRTIVVPMEYGDIEVGDSVHFPDEFWTTLTNFWGPGQWEKIKREPDNYKNPAIYKIWLAKPWFVNQAIQMNPFNSSLYSWLDIGQMRSARDQFCGDIVMRHPEIVPNDGRLMLFMSRDVKEEDQLGFNNSIFFGRPYIAGGLIAGYADAWPRFMVKMEESILLYVHKGKFLRNDQGVMQTACMRTPGLCAVSRLDARYEPQNINKFFRAKHMLKDGANPCIWDPGTGLPLKGEPGYCEE